MKRRYQVELPRGIHGEDCVHEVSSMQRERGHGFAIEATEDEVAQLRGLFQQVESADQATFGAALVPFLNFKRFDRSNHRVDEVVGKIYDCLFQWGTEETRDQLMAAGHGDRIWEEEDIAHGMSHPLQ